MYKNIRAELGRRNMTILTLSEKTGIRYQTLTAKLKGDSDITLDEAKAIKTALETGLPIEELFERDEVKE